jgi:membrane fusion protein, macrolide-specific efflux system
MNASTRSSRHAKPSRCLVPMLFTVLGCCLAGCTDRRESARAAVPAAPASAPLAMARGRVDVDGGVLQVAARRDGVVAQAHAQVGDEVQGGQLLARLESRSVELNLSLAQAEVAQAQAQAAAQRARLPALQARAARWQAAADQDAAPAQTADDTRAAVTELQADLAVSAASVTAARRREAQAVEAVRAGEVRAPVAGRILERRAQPGQLVAANTALFTLLPARPQVVLAELSDELVGRVKIGMRAEVVPLGDESAVQAARVVRIGETFGPARLAEDPQQAGDCRSVECVLRLDAASLRIGQRVRVRFLP